MVEYCRQHTKWLILILLGLFFVTFIINDYNNEPRKAQSACTECVAEVEVDDTEWEEDDLIEEGKWGLYSMEVNGIVCIFLNPMRLSPLKLSADQFRGLVRRNVPLPNSTYNQFFKNGMNLYQVYAIFYFENQLIKLWILQVF
jgi:hypothetical protein